MLDFTMALNACKTLQAVDNLTLTLSMVRVQLIVVLYLAWH
jgi:hypothetical protein